MLLDHASTTTFPSSDTAAATFGLAPVRRPAAAAALVLGVDVPRAGVDVTHDPQFCIDRPKGSGDYLFLHFLTPINIRSVSGVAVAPAGSCMLYAPGFHQWYRGHLNGQPAGFRHHWFHFDGPQADDLVARFGIPVNTVLQPGSLDFVPALISDMCRERARREEFAIESRGLLVAELLLNLARRCHQPSEERLTPHQVELLERFRDVRSRVHEQLHRRWSVADMAAQVHLSESRFATLFTGFFHVSPTEDLIRARIDKARWLLTNTSLAVKQVAAQSGFPNLHYFSRLFHRRVGCAPRDYYRRFVANAGSEVVPLRFDARAG
jgi:AraC-like DNA-binding protein